MKIVNIIGGLGNQMFQYAFAIALKKRFPEEEVLIDTSHFKSYKLHNGFELDKIFDISLEVANKNQLQRVTRYINNYFLSRIVRKLFPKLQSECVELEDYKFESSTLDISGDCYYEGYWQTWKYFCECEDVVRQEFSSKIKLDDLSNTVLANMLSHNSVAIHVRRGDYVNSKNFADICTIEYYSKAIKYIKTSIENPQFYIFSNDIDWCKSNLVDIIGESPVTYVTHNKGKSSYKDMVLMSKAKCCIIANSSFSWWGAWLNSEPDHITIAPNKWMNSSDCNDIFPQNWILM